MSLSLEAEMGLVKELEDAITAFWEPHCLLYWRKHEWIRRWGWKSDVIHVVHNKHRSVLVNLDVLLPPEPGMEVYERVAATSLGLLAGRDTEQAFALPRYPWRLGRFIPSVMELMPLAVSWYERFDTSTKCLYHMLADPHIDPDSPGCRFRRQYLENLPEAASQGCCILNLTHQYPEKYHESWRSLFDVRWKGPLSKTLDSERDPEFTIGARVADKHGMEATVIAIDPNALEGHGMLTVRFEEDGSETTLPLDDSDLKFLKLEDE
jgi:hypothetical protein